jgi:hypothetical protein
MSYIVPTSELTLTKQEAARDKAVQAGIARAVALKVIGDPKQGIVREADNVGDFGAGVGGWLTMPLLVLGNPYSVFATVVPGAVIPVLAVNRVAVFYKVNIEEAPSPVNQLIFREGATAGTTLAFFDLEGLNTKLEAEGYFTEPVWYDPQRVLNIVVICRIATALQARVRLGCFIIEPSGPVISS